MHMLQLIAIFLGVLSSRFVAHSDQLFALNLEVGFKQLPQAYAISDGELRPVYAVTGSLTEPLIFPAITLTLKAPNVSNYSAQSSFSTLFVEPGVLLTSCFFKGPDVEADSFEEGFCLRWLHPVGVYDSASRRRIAKRMVVGTFFDQVPVLKRSTCLPIHCPRRIMHALALDFDELSAAFHRRIDERTVEDFFFDDGIYRVRSEFQAAVLHSDTDDAHWEFAPYEEILLDAQTYLINVSLNSPAKIGQELRFKHESVAVSHSIEDTSWYKCTGGSYKLDLPFDRHFEGMLDASSRVCIFSNLCSDEHGQLVYFDSSDPAVHSNWRLESWGNQQLFHSGAIAAHSNASMPKILRGFPSEKYTWSDANVHVLFSHAYIYNFGFALFDLYASFKGMHLFDRFDYNESQLVLLGGCRGRDDASTSFGQQEDTDLCERVFGVDGWIKGVSARAAVPFKPLTCYRNAIVGATAVYNLYSFNYDAGNDMRQFTREFLSHFVPDAPPGPTDDGAPRVLVLIRHKLRPDASNQEGREFFVKSPWNFRSLGRVAAAALHIDENRVSSLDIITLPLKEQIAAVRAADLIISPDGGISYILAFARPSTAALVLSCQYAKDLHITQYWSFLAAHLHLHCSEQDILVDAIRALRAVWIANRQRNST